MEWEFCVQCSESLQNVTVAAAAPAAVSTVEGPPEGFPWMSLLQIGVIVVIGAIAMARMHVEPQKVDPESFVLPTLPPSTVPAVRPAARPAKSEAFEKGRVLLRQGDGAAALPLLAQAVADDPDNAEYHDAYGTALSRSGADGQAIDQYTIAVGLSPQTATYRLNRAKALALAQRPTEAIGEYEALLAIQPGNDDGARALAQMYLKFGKVAAAVPLLRRVAQRQPEDLVLQQTLAHALEVSGDLAGAAEGYQRVLDAVPDGHLARGRLAEVLLKQDRPEDAVGVLRAGLQQFPQAALLHRGLGSMLERTGNIEEAIAEYREYARLAPASDDARQLTERAEGLESRLPSSSGPSS